ncbi:NTP transferase domain-containing protein [Lacisediminihabitans profunda]|uniref:NTP transferase domain-containing protein n=1 Tax=Lacisediminihabitans profunda TaxID=2594790 RepID=A0A5C8UUT7_9MICO|nr:NTP transferase domain-containing protein [Lacisediminihabitans profunda]TXN32071.1 NTP transferase domain-containing protein [Lacisediminihabitans profunda]
MNFDAIVLAGGRSSRLGGEPKAALRIGDRALLTVTLDAAAGARRTVVVGDPAVLVVPAGALVVRESPAFAGPAAAIAAGLAALGDDCSDYLLVLACDMPAIAGAVPPLLERAGHAVDGAIAVDETGSPQYLAAVYRTASLAAAVRSHASRLENLSVRALLAGLDLARTTVPPGSTSDVDTWTDAARFGIDTPASPPKETPMPAQDDDEKMAALTRWSSRLSVELGVDGIDVDLDAVLALAGTVAHEVMRPAAPLTTYIVGYAAGLAAAGGSITPRAAFERAAAAADALARSDDR